MNPTNYCAQMCRLFYHTEIKKYFLKKKNELLTVYFSLTIGKILPSVGHSIFFFFLLKTIFYTFNLAGIFFVSFMFSMLLSYGHTLQCTLLISGASISILL